MKTWYQINKAQRIERWENALRVLKALTPHERKRHFDMSRWGAKTACGTVACAAGYCGLDPWFRRQGFKMRLKERVIVLDQNKVDDVLDLHADSWSYYGDTIKIRVTVTDIDSVDGFFGSEGAEKIFWNDRKRPVDKVIREIQSYIKKLRQEPEELVLDALMQAA